jgi:hypothetical protein
MLFNFAKIYKVIFSYSVINTLTKHYEKTSDFRCIAGSGRSTARARARLCASPTRIYD